MFFHVNIFAGWLCYWYSGTWFVVVVAVIRFLLFLCIINDFECKRYFSFSCGFDVIRSSASALETVYYYYA